MQTLAHAPLAVRSRRALSPTADRREKARAAALLLLVWFTITGLGWVLLTG